MKKRIETHACVSDGLGLESIGHEDGGPWKLVERKTGKFLAIVRFCPWCGKSLTVGPVWRAAKKAESKRVKVEKVLRAAAGVRKAGGLPHIRKKR